jgi:aspartate/methionine/tyrosine aminotransferase
MEWAKTRPRARIDLASSNLLACTLEDLPGAREAVEIEGESPDGYRPLVEAIAARYGVSPDCVATAGGCSGANFLTLAALVEAGDEVLVERPNYDPLPGAARLLGATVATFERRFDEAYRIDPDRVAAAVTPRTRLIVVSSPHNPSGIGAGAEELAGLARVAERTGVPVLFDEVYLDAVPEDHPAPAATRSPLFLSTNSLTKSYGLASLRCGWTLGSPEIVRRIRRVRDVVDVWAPIPSDRLSVLALRNIDRLTARAHRIVSANKERLHRFLGSSRDLVCVPPQGPLAFPRFRDGRETGPFVRRLFEEQGVAVAAGTFFDSPSHFRVALGGDPAVVEEGLAAIARSLGPAGP